MLLRDVDKISDEGDVNVSDKYEAWKLVAYVSEEHHYYQGILCTTIYHWKWIR